MQARALALPGVFEIMPRRIRDERGFFSETYNEAAFTAAGIPSRFVQDNQSYSVTKGTIRGLHYQLAPRAQAKLLRVLRGAVLDVVVDIRLTSPSFGRWLSLEISAETGNGIFVPEGFAHGYCTLQPDCEVFYKVSDFYSPQHERAIRHDDPDLAIEWPAGLTPILSPKDAAAPFFRDAELFA